MAATKRLTKSTADRRLCGVAGGLAEHFDIDPTLVRLGFVVAAFCWGLGIVLYLVACVVMPHHHSEASNPASKGTTEEEIG